MTYKRKQQPLKEGWHKKRALVTIAAFVLIIAVTAICSYLNYVEIEKQMKQNLTDVAQQSASVLNAKVDAQYRFLSALSKDLKDVTEDTIQEKLDHFGKFIDDINVKRFAFCFPDGKTYSTDGSMTDLEYREFFKEGMQGNCYITEVLDDAIQEESSLVNVMTIPVYNGEEIVGVFGVAYDSENFNETFQIESFQGRGTSCVINGNGSIMAVIPGNRLQLGHDMIEDVLADTTKNKQAAESIRMQLSSGEDASGVLWLNEKSYYYSVPIHLMDDTVTWYVMSIVPSDVLGERVFVIQRNQLIAGFLICVLVLSGAMIMISVIREGHKKMIRAAYEDKLTHGANYIKFCEDIATWEQPGGWLVLVDILNFNNISVVAGEAAGNRMIVKTWDVICSHLKEKELACHMRDDIFLLYLYEEKEKELLYRLKEMSKKITGAAEGFHVYGIEGRYGIYWKPHAESMETAYSKVKIACEYAAEARDVHYAFYDEENREKMQHEKHLETRFPSALEKEEFEVWYQPKYGALDCCMVGSEALVRWRTEEGAMVSPGEFIPLFEKNGMIVKLDEYMFRMVCRQQRKWMDEGIKVSPVSVNISRASLYRLGVEDRYAKIMLEYQINPELIQIEVTETVMEEKTDIGDILNKFRQMGVKILMDDFGTGYSSFATLSSQCFDTLKIDKTLVDHIGEKDGETMLFHLIRMGQQMGLHITAEGVEEKSQLEFLQGMKCDDIQGFYFSRPVCTEEFEKMISC